MKARAFGDVYDKKFIFDAKYYMGRVIVNIQVPFTVYGWARSEPMREDVTYITSALIGWDLHYDGLEQDCSVSIANALEILQCCIKPSIRSFETLDIVKYSNDCIVPCIQLDSVLKSPP